MAVGPYEGLHAFAFIRSAEPGTRVRDLVAALRSKEDPERGPIFAASEVVGPYAGFVHLGAEDLGALQDVIAEELWGRGAHGEHAVEWRPVRTADGVFGPRRWAPRFVGLVRLWTEAGAAEDVLGRLPEALGGPGGLFNGASAVFGSFDILLQMGSDEALSPVMDAVPGLVHRLEGVARTETAFAILR